MQSLGNSLKIIEKLTLLFFDRVLRLEEGCYKSEICDWLRSSVRGTIRKNFPCKTWEIWYFSSFIFISSHVFF